MEEQSACKLPNTPHPGGTCTVSSRGVEQPRDWQWPRLELRGGCRKLLGQSPHAPVEHGPDTWRDRPAFDGAARHSDVRVRRASGEECPGGGGLGGLGATGT